MMRQKGNCNRIYRSVEWSIVKMQNEDDMQCQGEFFLYIHRLPDVKRGENKKEQEVEEDNG